MQLNYLKLIIYQEKKDFVKLNYITVFVLNELYI